MRDESHTLDTPDGPMELYEAVPDGAPSGGVIVIQEAFGLNEHIRDVVRRFAAAGHRAVAPALFHRAGGGTAPYGEFAKVLPLFAGLTDEGILDDVDAARAHLNEAGLPDASLAVVGFCFGGRASFLVAARRRLGACVGFYGGGLVTARRREFPALVGEAGKLATPWLGLFGDEDRSIPVEDVEALREALRAAPVVTEVVRYPDAGHGFHCDVRPEYHEASARDAWARTLAWLRTHLARPAE
jgi:carboxymethylenebutenolidase